jgi:hypothetical protein
LCFDSKYSLLFRKCYCNIWVLNEIATF